MLVEAGERLNGSRVEAYAEGGGVKALVEAPNFDDLFDEHGGEEGL